MDVWKYSILSSIGILVLILGVANLVYDVYKNKSSFSRYFGFLATVLCSVILVSVDEVKSISTKIGSVELFQRAREDVATIEGLRKRVESQSATIDLIAKEASSANNLSNQAFANIQTTKKQIDELDKTVALAKNILSGLQERVGLEDIISAAQNDDLIAYNNLLRIARNPKDQFWKQANQAANAIAVASESSSAIQYLYQVQWNPGIIPERLLSHDLINQYFNGIDKFDVISRLALLQFISRREDLRIDEKVEFWLNVAEKETSVKVASFALRSIYSATGAPTPILNAAGAREWWNKYGPQFWGP